MLVHQHLKSKFAPSIFLCWGVLYKEVNQVEHFANSAGGRTVSHTCLTPPYSLDSAPFDGDAFVALIVNNDLQISTTAQNAISRALVTFGCRYAVCMGHNCSSWDDSVDYANIENDPELTPEKFVMTTWHSDESVELIAHFFLNCTSFSDNTFDNFLVLSIGRNDALLAEIQRECTAA